MNFVICTAKKQSVGFYVLKVDIECVYTCIYTQLYIYTYIHFLYIPLACIRKKTFSVPGPVFFFVFLRVMPVGNDFVSVQDALLGVFHFFANSSFNFFYLQKWRTFSSNFSFFCLSLCAKRLF